MSDDDELTPEELDEYLYEEKTASEQDKLLRRDNEFNLWQTWKQAPTKDTLHPLLRSFDNVVVHHVNRLRNDNIPPLAIEAEVKGRVVDAFHSYDPKYGASLNTWVNSQTRAASRLVKKYQNMGKIPETRIAIITDYKNAKSELRDSLNREPSTIEIAEHMQLPINKVSMLEKEMRPDVVGMSEYSSFAVTSSEDAMTLRLVYYELTSEEQIVYDYTLGEHGKPRIPAGDIAQKLNTSPAGVSRLRKSIQEKIDKYSNR